MRTIAPAKDIKIKAGTADAFIKAIRKTNAHSGQQRLLKQAISMTEYNDEKLSAAVSKMSDNDRAKMAVAINTLSRISNAIQPQA